MYPIFCRRGGMSMDKEKVLKIIVGAIGGYHLFIGILGMFFKNWMIFFAKVFFGFKLDSTPQMHWVINPMSAYFFIFGLIFLVAAFDPVRYRPILFAGWGIFFIRIIQRIIFIFSAPNHFFVYSDPSKYYVFLAFLIFLSLTLLTLLIKVKE
jgi:hypothetical protein